MCICTGMSLSVCVCKGVWFVRMYECKSLCANMYEECVFDVRMRVFARSVCSISPSAHGPTQSTPG